MVFLGSRTGMSQGFKDAPRHASAPAKKYEPLQGSLSPNLVHVWLTQYERGELDAEEAEATLVTEYEAKIAALERKVGQLTMELDLLKKAPRLRLVSDNETPSIISGPKAVPSDGGVK